MELDLSSLLGANCEHSERRTCSIYSKMAFAGIWFGVVVVVAAAFVQCTLAATTYNVGDESGWFVPGNTTFYKEWVGSKTFRVGDSLYFSFKTGEHDVAPVNQSQSRTCPFENLSTIIKTGPASVPLETTGEQYYICTFENGGHCRGGQKLAINVVAASTNTATPPPPSSASALAGVAAVFFSVFTAWRPL